MNKCLNCQKMFTPKKNTKGLYCSRECSRIAWSRDKKATFNCPCGKQFERYFCQIKNGKESVQYCSQHCANFYSSSSFTVNDFRLDRDNYQFKDPSDKLGNYSHLSLGKRSLASLKNPHYDHHFFQNGITNEIQAYVFGILLTDGGLAHLPDRNNAYRLSLKLGDGDIVKKVHQTFRSSKPIKLREGKYHEFQIYSRVLANDLIALGCPPHKTKIANYPLIPKELDAHFIRGVIDGDGSWSTRKRDNSCELKIHGNDLLLYGTYLKLKEHLGVEPQTVEYPIDYDSNYKMKSYAVMRYSTHKSELIAEFLYKDATIYGERKRDIVFSKRSILI